MALEGKEKCDSCSRFSNFRTYVRVLVSRTQFARATHGVLLPWMLCGNFVIVSSANETRTQSAVANIWIQCALMVFAGQWMWFIDVVCWRCLHMFAWCLWHWPCLTYVAWICGNVVSSFSLCARHGPLAGPQVQFNYFYLFLCHVHFWCHRHHHRPCLDNFIHFCRRWAGLSGTYTQLLKSWRFCDFVSHPWGELFGKSLRLQRLVAEVKSVKDMTWCMQRCKNCFAKRLRLVADVTRSDKLKSHNLAEDTHTYTLDGTCKDVRIDCTRVRLVAD